MMLNDKQTKAYNAVMDGKNVFITGSGGTGKSYLLDQIQRGLDHAEKEYIICAPTAAAALLVGGVTVNRAFNLPAGPAVNSEKMKIRSSAPDILKRADVVIIDEISMCRIDIFDAVAKSIRKAERAVHKKIQLVVIGDFCQLPPVLSDDNGERNLLTRYYGEDIGRGYAFQSKDWKKFHFTPIVLDQVIRQLDSTFIKHLNEARFGNLDCLPYFVKNCSDKCFEDGIYISGTRSSVDEINARKLGEIQGRQKNYRASVSGVVRDSDFIVAQDLQLKVGARIYVAINDPHGEYVNGSLGTVTRLDEDEILVKLDELPYLTSITRHTWRIYSYIVNEDGKIEKIETGSYEQFPLRLAYAITTHKSQGASFNKVNLDPYSWDVGQLYVALSRVRSIDGLYIKGGIKPEYLQTDKDVLEFYRTMSGGPVKKEADEKRSRGRPKKFHGASTVMRVPNELSEPLKRILEDWSENEKRNELELVLIPHKYMDDVEDILNRKK